MRIVKLRLFPVPVRLHSGFGGLEFVVVSRCFEVSGSVVRGFEPGETPSNSVSQRAPSYARRSWES